MDIGTIAGLVIAVAAILISVVVSGGSITGLINGPSIFVVLVGTLGATIVSFPLARLLKLHTVVLKRIFSKTGTQRQAELVQLLLSGPSLLVGDPGMTPAISEQPGESD